MFKKNVNVGNAFTNQGNNASSVIINENTGLKLKWNQFDVYTVENLFTFEVSSYD